jgi:hypothetical protein
MSALLSQTRSSFSARPTRVLGQAPGTVGLGAIAGRRALPGPGSSAPVSPCSPTAWGSAAGPRGPWAASSASVRGAQRPGMHRLSTVGSCSAPLPPTTWSRPEGSKSAPFLLVFPPGRRQPLRRWRGQGHCGSRWSWEYWGCSCLFGLSPGPCRRLPRPGLQSHSSRTSLVLDPGPGPDPQCEPRDRGLGAARVGV